MSWTFDNLDLIGELSVNHVKLAIIPIVIAFLFLQRYWQSGLSAGGVKA